MSEWQNVKLADLGSLQRGRSRHRPRYAFHLYNGPYPFIQTGEVRSAGKYITKYETTYSEDGLKQSKLWPKGTLCITIAANIAEIAILDFDACFPDSILGFIPDEEKSNLDFVYYLLIFFQKQLKHIGEGSVQDNINLGTFENIEFPIPPLPEQKAIADVLSALDDKIDLLQRQNETLEKMAETLFRQWFIEEAKEDWEEVILKDICFVIDNRGKTPPYSDMQTSHPIVEVNALTDISRNINYSVIRKYVDDQTFNTWFRQYLEPKDILISTVGSIGSIAMFFDGGACVAQNVIGLRSTQKVSNLYLYQWLLFMQDEIKELDIGSVQPSIKVPHLLSLSIKIPTDNLLLKFDQILNEFVEKIEVNAKQIQTLQNLRDTLLPKLMSGEVRVKLD